MSQNPNGGPNYNPYGPGPSNPNYPPVSGPEYNSGQPPSGPNYGQYAPPPPVGPGDPTPHSSYGSPYAPPPPPLSPGADPSSGPYGAYDPTVVRQNSGAAYPSYPSYPQAGGQTYPPYSQPGSGDFQTPPPSKPRRNNARTVLIAVITLVIIVGGVLGVVFYNNHTTQVRNANSTATVQAKSTGTAQAHTQATANAQATASYVTTHYPFSTNLVLDDPLTDNSHSAQYGWDVGSDCAFSNGTYQATIDKAGYFSYCTAENVSFSNFTYEVQMSIQKGGDGATGGVVFRANMESSLFYVFYLSKAGSYYLDIQTNSNATNTRTLKSGTVPGFASGFFQVHTIGVVANGSQISVYVDHNKITDLTDSTYTRGQIGIISDYGSSTTVVVYNHAKVWQIS